MQIIDFQNNQQNNFLHRLEWQEFHLNTMPFLQYSGLVGAVSACGEGWPRAGDSDQAISLMSSDYCGVLLEPSGL